MRATPGHFFDAEGHLFKQWGMVRIPCNKQRGRRRRGRGPALLVAPLVGLFLLLSAAPALALQPLESFVRAALDFHPDSLRAAAAQQAQAAEVKQSLGKVLPGLDVLGSYRRNQFEIAPSIPLVAGAPPIRLVITPANQLDGIVTLRVPLVNLQNFVRLGAAHWGATAAELSAKQTLLDVQSTVVQNYYQLVANVALVQASEHALEVARESLRLTRDRLQAGSAAALDVDRAQAEMERQVQQLSSANLQLSLAARALQSLSDLSPELGHTPALSDDLGAEQPLEHFDGDDDALPSIGAAAAAHRRDRELCSSQWLSLVPVLSGLGVEHATNASGFNGQKLFWAAEVDLSWKIDLTLFGQIDAARATAARAAADERTARLRAHDGVYRAWHTVAANVAQSRSARAEARVRAEAAELAHDRYAAGVATQLDLLQAQRDAFAADVTRIQADANLVNARLQLRLAAGRAIVEG